MSSSLRRTFHELDLDTAWQILSVASRITSRSATDGGNCGLLAVVMPCKGAFSAILLSCLIQKQGHYNSGVRMDMYGYSFYVSILPLHTFAASITTREIRDGCTAAQLCLLFALTKSSFIDFRRLASSCAWRRRATNSFKSTRPLPEYKYEFGHCHTLLGDSFRFLTFNTQTRSVGLRSFS